LTKIVNGVVVFMQKMKSCMRLGNWWVLSVKG